MTWLSTKETADLLKIGESAVKKAVKKDKYEHRRVDGIGQGGRQLQISLESVYAKYPHLREEADHSSILSYTGKQRADADRKASIIEMYWLSKKPPKEFIEAYNAENPNEDLTETQLMRWQTKYKQRRCVTDLIDGRGSLNSGATSLPSDIWDYFYCCYMTQQKRSVKLCYDLTVKKFGDCIPSVSTFERAARKIPMYATIEYRYGEKALKDALPSMERCREDIFSNDIWCSDHHLTDLFVKSEDGKKAVRLWLTVFHDMRSNKIVSFLARNSNPNATAVKKCFRLGVERYGVPNEVYFDNGKDYRSKSFAEDYPMSLVNQLGFNIIYATPYHGQAKPTERFFRTFEERFSKLFPTYAGCNAKDRPECMQTNEKKIIECAPDFKEYLEYLEQYIGEYNNTVSRAEGLNNQCPDKVYYDNLQVKREISDHAILKILCGTVDTRTVQKNGVTVKGRTYRSEYLIPYLGEKVHVIFDPDNMDEVNVFDIKNRAICVAQATIKTMFRHTTEEDYRRAEKEKKAVRAFNKKYKPAREFSVPELIAKQQFEELQYEQNGTTTTIEQVSPQVTANASKLRETKQPKRIPNEENIANILLDLYSKPRKTGG